MNGVVAPCKCVRQAYVSNRNCLQRKTIRTQESCYQGVPVHRQIQVSASMPPAQPNEPNPVYSGMYGPWTIEPEDVREVYLYRVGISIAAVSAALVASSSLIPFIPSFPTSTTDGLCVLGALGFGMSLLLIHVYVTPLKRFVQIMWAVGFIASLAIMGTNPDVSVVSYVAENPSAVWFVGPLFAAVTGVALKEGLCYGKAEAGILMILTPMLMLSHLSQAIPPDENQMLLGAWVFTLLVFAGRKYTQAVKDDIGDKSVFEFQKLSEQEQQALLNKLQAQSTSIEEE